MEKINNIEYEVEHECYCESGSCGGFMGEMTPYTAIIKKSHHGYCVKCYEEKYDLTPEEKKVILLEEYDAHIEIKEKELQDLKNKRMLL